jgi:tight adherence protein B
VTRPAAIVVALAIALGWTATAWADGALLSEGAGARFPDRVYALTLPAPRALADGSVRVTENGHAVEGLSVTPAAGASAYRFGVVLAIDASMSMRGRPLRSAVAAARRFVTHRNEGQPVAIVTFAGTTQVAQPFTSDAAAIEAALSGIRPRNGGTRLLDAAGAAVGMLASAHIASGSVILLSDGGDHASATTAEGVTAAASRAGVRIFGVGMPSAGANFGPLNLLAASTGGEFSSVTSTNDLTRVYDRLGARLASQYEIRYRSTAAPGTRVQVRAAIAGADVATSAYTSPALHLGPRTPFRHSPSDAFWLSPAASVAVSLVIALLFGLALWLLLRPRGGSMRGRLAEYVGPAEADDAGSGQLTGRMLVGAARSLERTAWGPRLAERLDIAGIEVPPARLVVWIGAVTFVLMLALFAGGGPGAGLLAFAVPVGSWALISRRVKRQRRLFCDQLPDNLQVIASAMRAGHSFSGALSVVVEDAPEPTRRELQRVIADERLGVPVEEALEVVVRRMDSSDLGQVALVAALQRETGGNTAEVLDRVTETVRDRLALRRMVQTLTAQGRMSRWVVSALPVALLAVITVINPDYTRPLYTTGFGHLVLIVSGVMVISGSLVIKRIVDIKV